MLYVYIGCLAFGVIYSIASAVLGGHGFDHGADGGVDIDGGTDTADVPSIFNPVVIASAIAAFGAAGIIAKTGFNMGDLLSAIVALSFAGVIGAAIFFGIVKFMYGSQSNSTFSEEDVVGVEAQVITPIPAEGVGEVAYVTNGVRYTLAARSQYGKPIPKGEIVKIKDITNHTAFVTPKITIDNYEVMEEQRIHKENQKNNKL